MLKLIFSKQLQLLSLSLSACCLFSSPVFGNDQADDFCAAHLLMDLDSSTILRSENIDQALPPASMVKLMTLYTILNKIDQGLFTLEDQVTISAEASKIGGSQVYLKQGEVFSVGDLLDALMIQSGNDAAHALAEFASGSVEAFVEEMNQDAEKLTLTHSTFRSPHGLPADRDRGPDMATARDFSTLARTLLQKFPEVIKLTSISEKPFRNGTFIMRNHNHLLGKFGIDGLKTGFHSKAGFNLTATAEKEGVRFISVVMGCKQRKVRDSLTASLIREGAAKIRRFDFTALAEKEELTASVKGGVPSVVPLALSSPLQAVLSVDDKPNVKIVPSPCQELVAPFEGGETCGSVKLLLGEKVIQEVPLVSELSARKQTFMEMIKTKVGW